METCKFQCNRCRYNVSAYLRDDPDDECLKLEEFSDADCLAAENGNCPGFVEVLTCADCRHAIISAEIVECGIEEEDARCQEWLEEDPYGCPHFMRPVVG